MTAILFGTALIALFVLVIFLIGHEPVPPGMQDGMATPGRNSDAILADLQSFVRKAELEALRRSDAIAPAPLHRE
jgi:cell shape-determining protein MreC